MKTTKKVLLTFSAIIAITMMIIGTAQLNADSKVDLHHGSKEILISIDIHALPAHLRHGDWVHKLNNGNDDDYVCSCGS